MKNNAKLLISFKNINEIPNDVSKTLNICDLKDPRSGTIGAWKKERIREVVKKLKKKIKLSATVGDIDCNKEIIKKINSFDELNLDYLKFGFISPKVSQLQELIKSLGGKNYKTIMVFVIFVDIPNVFDFVKNHMEFFSQNNLNFFILDTFNKNGQDLLSFCSKNCLKDFIEKCREKNIQVGLAGRLNKNHIKFLVPLNPYVMGFRSAVCKDSNRDALCKEKILELSNYFFQREVKQLTKLERDRRPLYKTLSLKNHVSK